MDPVVADAEIARLEAQFQHADEHLKRVEPLLPLQFVTTDNVEKARTERASALAALNEARARKQAAIATLSSTRAQHVATEAALRQARSQRASAEDAIGQYEGINASIAAAEAAVHSAELDLNYCRVVAPFTGKVVNMNISKGAFARAGVEVFTLVDTSTWYVVANFRETQLRHIPAGAPVDVYLQSQPSRHFRGTVVGLGWAVLPENGTSVNGLPRVERSLDWIRLAARFPIRIKVDNPDDSDVSDYARGHGRHRNRIDPGFDRRHRRFGTCPPCLEDFTGYCLAASLLFGLIPIRRIIPQACANDRGAGLCHWSPGIPCHDSSRYSPAESGSHGRVRPLDLVVRDAGTFG